MDPPAVITLGQSPEQTWFEPLHKLTIKRFDIPDPLPAEPKSQTAVRVAVLDTAATTKDEHEKHVHDLDGHGISMGKIIETVACLDKPQCSVDVRYYPVLPFKASDQDLFLASMEAGNLGSRGDLAAQIYRATHDWLNLPEPRAPLIINMSLGWSGCYEKPLSLPSRSVRRALQYAQCRGALIFVAGGNTDVIQGCPYPGGEPQHMFPGLWGGSKVTAEMCRAVGVHDHNPSAPLLLGIGAVDYRDNQLSITDHESDLVAYGQAVTVKTGATWRKSTGTSAATAAMSGAAALALRYRPELTREKSIALLYGAAVELHNSSRSAPNYICNKEYSNGCPERPVSRLSVCKLLNQLGLTTESGTENYTCEPLARNALTSVGLVQLDRVATAA